MKIRIDQQKHAANCIRQIREIVRGYPGSCQLQLLIRLDDGSEVLLKSHSTQVEINPQLRARIDDLLGPGHYHLIAGPSLRGNGNGRK